MTANSRYVCFNNVDFVNIVLYTKGGFGHLFYYIVLVFSKYKYAYKMIISNVDLIHSQTLLYMWFYKKSSKILLTNKWPLFVIETILFEEIVIKPLFIAFSSLLRAICLSNDVYLVNSFRSKSSNKRKRFKKYSNGNSSLLTVCTS